MIRKDTMRTGEWKWFENAWDNGIFRYKLDKK